VDAAFGDVEVVPDPGDDPVVAVEDPHRPAQDVEVLGHAAVEVRVRAGLGLGLAEGPPVDAEVAA
jgi:hypothetical protein